MAHSSAIVYSTWRYCSPWLQWGMCRTYALQHCPWMARVTTNKCLESWMSMACAQVSLRMKRIIS